MHDEENHVIILDDFLTMAPAASIDFNTYMLSIHTGALYIDPYNILIE